MKTLAFSFILLSLSVSALTLPDKYLVLEIQPHPESGHNFIVLQNFPGVLNVAAKNAVVFECLRKSLNEKITVKIEIDKKQEIQNCQF
jgi:hypothetical protein